MITLMVIVPLVIIITVVAIVYRRRKARARGDQRYSQSELSVRYISGRHNIMILLGQRLIG